MSVVANCLCLKLRMASRSTTMLYDAALQPTDLSSSQFSALRNIHRFEPKGVAELAKIMLLERTTLTRNMDLLEERGFVRLHATERDGRVRRPELTGRGERKLEAAIPRWRTAQRKMLSGLGAQGWVDLQSTLRTIAAINDLPPERLYEFAKGPNTWAKGEVEPELDSAEMQRCVNSTLRGGSRYLTRQYDAELRRHGLKTTQFHVLAAIDENPGVRITELASLLALDQASATLAVAAMRRLGWVQMNEDRSIPDPEVPSKAIELTREGTAVFSSSLKSWRACATRKLAGADRKELTRWSSAIGKALTTALNAKPS